MRRWGSTPDPDRVTRRDTDPATWRTGGFDRRDSTGVHERLGGCSDADLLAMVADEHRDALTELYRRHAGWLLARLRHRCADDGVVAEALQDTFVAVWRGAGSYEGTGAAAGWMWSIAIRRLIGILRKRRPEPAPTNPFAVDVLADVEELVLSRTEHGDLAGALRSLSPELRAVVQATVLDGLTTREASQLLGIPAGTVKTRMMRARVELRGALA